MRYKDISKQRFGRLTVLEFSHTNKHGCAVWKVKCRCGVEKTALGAALRSGGIKSCGCYGREKASKRLSALKYKHGLARHPVTGRHANMMQRCYNQNNPAYKNYGGRGIEVCDRWHTLTLYHEDIGDPPTKEHSIGRVNNEKGYSPENCTWETSRQQANNTRKNKLLTYNGQTLSVSQWARRVGKHPNTLYWRIRQGFSVDRVLKELN